MFTIKLYQLFKCSGTFIKLKKKKWYLQVTVLNLTRTKERAYPGHAAAVPPPGCAATVTRRANPPGPGRGHSVNPPGGERGPEPGVRAGPAPPAPSPERRPPPRPAPREAPTPRAGLRGDDRPAKVSGASARPPGPLPPRPRGRAGGSWARERLTHMLLKRNRSSHVKARRVVIAPPPQKPALRESAPSPPEIVWRAAVTGRGGMGNCFRAKTCLATAAATQRPLAARSGKACKVWGLPSQNLKNPPWSDRGKQAE